MAEDRPTDDPRDEGGEPGADALSSGLPPKLERWRRRSAAGAIMTGFALGLQEVFEPDRKGPSIVQETSGDPPEDLPVDADLDGVTARDSVVRIRPWLLERTDGGASSIGGAPAGSVGHASEQGPSQQDRSQQDPSEHDRPGASAQ